MRVPGTWYWEQGQGRTGTERASRGILELSYPQCPAHGDKEELGRGYKGADQGQRAWEERPRRGEAWWALAEDERHSGCGQLPQRALLPPAPSLETPCVT